MKAPPGETGTAAARRLDRDPLLRTLSVTEEVAALLTSGRCFTEVGHEAQKPGFRMCLAGATSATSAFSRSYVARGTASPASAEAMFMDLGLPGRG